MEDVSCCLFDPSFGYISGCGEKRHIAAPVSHDDVNIFVTSQGDAQFALSL